MVGRIQICLAVAAVFVVFSGGCGKSEGPSNVDPATAKLAATDAMLDHVVAAAKKFKAETGRVPKSLNELVAARALHIQKSADSWGQEFLVGPPENSTPDADTRVEICSAGPDMSPGTDDDICKNAAF